MLDFMRGDIARMNARLAAPEKARLDQYLASLREVERQLTQLGMAASCQPPARPGSADIRANLSALVDLTTAAHMCNLTRVSHVSTYGVDGPQVRYLADQSLDEHELHHRNDEAQGPNYRKLTEPARQVDAYILSKVAQTIGNLAKIPEGNGSTLDNSVVMYVNAAGGKHHQGHNNHAVRVVSLSRNPARQRPPSTPIPSTRRPPLPPLSPRSAGTTAG